MIIRKSKHEFRVVLTEKSTTDVRNMRDWCSETFGNGGRNPKYRWRYGWLQDYDDVFYFRSERDALYFDLRWA